MTTTPENSSAIDFVPGLAEMKSPAMQKVEDTARGLLAANTELQRQVAFWQRESGDVLDRAEEAERALASLHNVALLDVVAERDAALADLATEQSDLGGQLAQARADALNAAADRDQMREQRDFALVNLDRVITEREAAREDAANLRVVLGAVRDLVGSLRASVRTLLGEREEREGDLDDANALLNEVREAWTEHGRVPSYHQRQQKRLAREWPRLAVVVRKIAGGAL